jgi:plasmid stability protein
MANLLVRNLDEELVAKLKQRAIAHGRSAEAEHRDILRKALMSKPTEMPFGALRGQIWMASDFDETPADITDAMENGAL